MVQKIEKILVISGGAIEASFILKYIEDNNLIRSLLRTPAWSSYIGAEKNRT